MNDARLFDFESDFVATLRCIPMAVRFKLDRCGIKVSLRQWSRLTVEDRRDLLIAPCDGPEEVDAYRGALVARVAERTGEAANPLPEPAPTQWMQDHKTPAAVCERAALQGVRPPSDRQWRDLTDLERFVLVKLSRDNHDNVNFIPALKEFGLLEREAAQAPV